MATKQKLITGLDRLGQEFDEESYHFLEEHRPGILAAIEQAVVEGDSPYAIWRFSIRNTGRTDIAKRCQAAARHLERGE